MEIPIERLAACLAARQEVLDEAHWGAVCLLNGFLEGCPGLVVEVYARTLVIKVLNSEPYEMAAALPPVWDFYRQQLPWLNAGLLKMHRGQSEEERCGRLVFGTRLDRRVREQGVWYALNLCMNQDTSFYIDTRNLRAWALARLEGKRVLNTFAYTGSLGVAARASGASQVVQVDLNPRFLNLAKDSYSLNGWPVARADFQAVDFFARANQFRRQGRLFDCVFLDPPFFSHTGAGRVDLVNESARLMNKVRPLVADGGYLVSVNNALFLSGNEYIETIQNLCSGGYLEIDSLLAIPPDCAGYPQTTIGFLPADPAPFNHATKIVVLRVKKKS